MTKVADHSSALAPCTLWSRHSVKDGWVFNHLEDGHIREHTPAPKSASQNGWKSMTWQREHAWLTRECPPRVVRALEDAPGSRVERYTEQDCGVC